MTALFDLNCGSSNSVHTHCIVGATAGEPEVTTDAFAPREEKAMEGVRTHQPTICYPEELQMLCRVVKKTCDWHGLGYGGQDAKDIATLAMSLFNSGLTNEEFLFKRLRREPLVRRTHRAFADLARSQRRPGRRVFKRLQGAEH